MAEQQAGKSLEVVQEELITDLRCLAVRRVHFQDWFKGAGALGTHTPIPSMWRAGRHLELGERIEAVLEDAAIRLLALSNEAVPRRLPKNGHFTGWQYSEQSGKPIHHSEIARVEHMDAGRNRLLPVLRLTEFGNRPDEREFMLSLPDLAYYVQGGEVELTVS